MRYITAGVLFLAMVLILVKVGSPKQPQNGQNVAATEVASEASDDAKQEFEVDAHEDVNTLINQYYTAYAAGRHGYTFNNRNPGCLKTEKTLYFRIQPVCRCIPEYQMLHKTGA